jgi:excisionase family DNA binding protein
MKNNETVPQSGEGDELRKYRLMNLQEAADFLMVSTGTLENWIYDNRYPGLKSIKLGRHRRFFLEDLLKFVMAKREETTLETESKKGKHLEKMIVSSEK